MNGDILYGMIGTIGKPTLVETDREFSIKNVALFKQSNANIDNKYLRWLLDSPAINKQIAHASKGGTQKFVSLGALRGLKATFPSYPEQPRIAAILDQAHALRAKRREALAQLNSLTQSIFIEMFGSSPKDEITIGKMLEEGVLLLRKDGNHGSLYPRADDFGETGVPFLSAKLITKDGLIDDEQVEHLRDEKARWLKIGWIEGGDVLLAHNASVGKVALYDGRFDSAIIGTSLTAFRPNPTRLDSFFLAASLRSGSFQRQLEKNMGQTTRNQVPITAPAGAETFSASY